MSPTFSTLGLSDMLVVLVSSIFAVSSIKDIYFSMPNAQKIQGYI
jgi:hypothetical protein